MRRKAGLSCTRVLQRPGHSRVHAEAGRSAAGPRRPQAQRQDRAESAERRADWSEERLCEIADILSPLTGATGPEGVRRLLGIALWIRNEGEQRHPQP